MNIAYFTDTYTPQLNGVTVSIENSVKELRSRGHKVYIFAPRIKGHKDKDPDVIRLNSFKVLSSEPEVLFPLLLPNKNYRKVASLSFNIVHGHGNGAFSLLGHQVARMRGIPYILTFHTLHTHYTHYILNGRVVNAGMVATALGAFGNICNGVVAPSLKMKKELINYGVKKDIRVVPNIIEVDKFSAAEKGFLRKNLGIDSKDPIILSVGRVTKEKNFSFIIKAFAKVVEKFPKANLVIVGQGPENKNLQKLIEKLGVVGRVHLTEGVPQVDMPKVYADADIFVFASKTETQGMTVFEAASAGLPLVVVDDEAFSQIAGSDNSFSLPLRQKDFVLKLLLLLKKPELATRMGKNSRVLVKKIYSPKKIADELETYYQEISNITIKRNAVNRILPKTTYKILTRASDTFEKLFK